jgi:KaiC domain protein
MSDDDWVDRVLGRTGSREADGGDDRRTESNADGADAETDGTVTADRDDRETGENGAESGSTAGPRESAPDADPFGDGWQPASSETDQDTGGDRTDRAGEFGGLGDSIDGTRGAAHNGDSATDRHDHTAGADAVDEPFAGGTGADGFEDAFGGVADDRTGSGRQESQGTGPFGDGLDGGSPGGDFDDVDGEFGGLGGDFDDDFGFGFEGDTGFDEAEFDSDIERIQIGIEGLDEMILGGVPRRSLMAAIGSAGTGKTTFALQFVHRALVEDRRAVYITLEESRERIVNTADEKGWEFSKHLAEDRLAIIDLDPIEMANSLSSIRNELPRLVDEFGADRLALDSVSLLEMMYDSSAERRSEVFDFARSLKRAGVTIMVTSEASEGDAYTSRYGLVEYLADAVFVLQYVRPSDFRETRLAVEIQKIRDANHSRETKPYEITNDGISVYQQANIF